MTSWTPGSPSSREASTRPSLPTSPTAVRCEPGIGCARYPISWITRSEEHTSELQSRLHLVCRLLLEKKKRGVNSAEHADKRRERERKPDRVPWQNRAP